MGVGASPASRKLAVLQDDDVHYFLQPIGVVVADTLERATYAAGLVTVKYDEGNPSAGLVTHLHDAFDPTRSAAAKRSPRDSSENAPVAALNSAPARIEAGLPDADREPQRHGAARHHRHVGRRPPDDL